MYVCIQGDSQVVTIPVKFARESETGTAEKSSQTSRVRFLRDDEWPQGWMENPAPDAQVPRP